MAESFNEDDDLKRLKEWWKQNGTALILGIGAGIVAIVGWQWWKGHVETQAYGASSSYQSFSEALAAKGTETDVAAQLENLRNEHGGSIYAARASLDLAGRYADEKLYGEAAALFDWVAENADDEGLRHIALSRQARVLWARGDDDKALALLDGDVPEAFKSLFSEIEGDIHLSAGNTDKALSAYKAAARSLPEGADPAPLKIKIESAGGQPDSAVASIREVS